MAEISFTQLGWLIGLAGVIFGVWGQIRNGRKDTEAGAREMAQISTKLDFVSQQVSDLKSQVSSFNGCIVDISGRLGAAEKSTERAHIRLDRIEGRRMNREVDEP